MWCLRKVTDLDRQAHLLRPRAHGVIEMSQRQLVSIALRPWPRVVSLAEARLAGRLYHGYWPGDRCRMYFNQPRAFPNFLVLKYTVSAAQTSWGTFYAALCVLDRIAEIKGSDALLCEASNLRISDRLFRRYGWEPHCPNSRRRHYIKRFDWPRRGNATIDAVAGVLASSAC